MNAPNKAAVALAGDYFTRYPGEAAASLETLPVSDLVVLLEIHGMDRMAPVLSRLRSGNLAELIEALDIPQWKRLAPHLEVSRLSAALARFEKKECQALLAQLPDSLARSLRELIVQQPDSAGSIMDPEVLLFRPEQKAREAFAQLRKLKNAQISEVYVVDSEGRLQGRVTVQDLALNEPTEPLSKILDPRPLSIPATAPRSEVVELLETHSVSSLPVVDFHGLVIGVIRYRALVDATAAEVSADIQTMVGASEDERALSPVSFAVRRRLPWLQINLVTAFLAASVVGLFESTISQFTALAVLLPVVAGQSGNTGAQALAVTMRGLALREVRPALWLRVGVKELSVGLLNGIAVALVTGLAVYAWSRSVGLAGVITVAMVISMGVAGLSGALIPMVLRTLGQDPAQSSSIVLTTVTDVVGFFSFLGLATLASGLL